jgi:hypothetical protein
VLGTAGRERAPTLSPRMKVQPIEKSEEAVAHDFERPKDSETKRCADTAQHLAYEGKAAQLFSLDGRGGLLVHYRSTLKGGAPPCKALRH